MSEPTVSVIIPAYNCGQMLREAVESVRRQTYQDIEVIIVDDGSTDDTPEIARELEANSPKIRVILAKHKGLAAARNRAIAEMRGQWIALLDADDLWIPEKLARCMDYLAANDSLSIVYTPMQPIRLNGEEMEGHSKPCHAGQLTRKLFKSIFVHDPAAVFHKRVIEKCGGFDEALPVCVGHEFWLRVSTQFEFGLIDEPLAQRRWHEKSLTRSNRARGRQIKAAMLERFYFERGGAELLDRKEAFHRLSRVHYSAGKILFKQGNFRRGRRFGSKAIRYNIANIKAYPIYAACIIGGLFCRDRTETSGESIVPESDQLSPSQRPDIVAAEECTPSQRTEIEAELISELREASSSFQTRGKRKIPKLDRIYQSFDLPYLSVSADDAQRDSDCRFERFGIRAESIRGKSILDLGSHTGGMIFASQKHCPGRCLGVEYDADKVRIAERVAVFNGLDNVQFLCRNVDKLKADELDGPFDVVYCLALEAHLKKPKKLYRLLAEVTSGTLYFEGNSPTDPKVVESQLRKNGFREVNYIGVCNDDHRPENNCRPMLVAVK